MKRPRKRSKPRKKDDLALAIAIASLLLTLLTMDPLRALVLIGCLVAVITIARYLEDR